MVRGLGDTWDDDAFVRDRETGRLFDPAGLHALDHKGAHFKVAGPLNVPRPPQGHPLLVQAGASDTGKRFAASVAEVIFTSHPSRESAVAFRAEMHALLAEYGRASGSLKIMTAITPIIGETREAAQALQGELDRLIPAPIAISKLQGYLAELDLSALDPDAPFPTLPAEMMRGQNSTRDRVVDMAAREGLTITQVAQRVAAGRTSRTSVGTAEDIADELEAWYSSGAADGFVISPPFLPGGLEDFVDQVVPVLQARGLFRAEYGGATLRANLGLTRPANRFDTDRSLRAVPNIW